MLTSSRTTNILLIAMIAVAIGIVAMLASGARGGPLDPPAAPASTMKTLQQVEPRTPISQPATAADFPIQINAPGSYYLTENVTGVAGKSGIVINADDVTLDLNGFSLFGGGFSTRGISDNDGFRTNLTIRNGVVRGWGTGLGMRFTTRSTFEDLKVTDGAPVGNGIDIGSGNDVRRVISRYNASGLVIWQVGDAWGSTVEDSNFSRNGVGIVIFANNVWVRDSVIDANSVSGIVIGGSSVGSSYNEITDNRITGNGTTGVAANGYAVEILANSNRNVIVRNVTDANTAIGEFLNSGAGNMVGPLQQPPITDPSANIGFP